jgi:predicted RNA binding protein YcfA (HicA-like mRNA interferase family)
MMIANVIRNFKDDGWQKTAQDYSHNEQGKSQNQQSEQLLIYPMSLTG